MCLLEMTKKAVQRTKLRDIQRHGRTGHWTLTVPSLRAAITFPRADRDLLMFLASSNTEPSAPVLLT